MDLIQGKRKMAKSGRPKIELDQRQLRELASIHCTMKEIAQVMGCSVDTLDRNYAEVIKQGQEEGKSSLRRAQFKYALAGNSGLLIWLGKQWLGQKEDPHTVAITEESIKAHEAIMLQLKTMQEKAKNSTAP
jgi:hypothetical protein